MAESRRRSDERSPGGKDRRLAEVVLHAAALDTEARDRYLRDDAGEDPALFAEARRRLRSALELGSSFLGRPVGRLFSTSTSERGNGVPAPEAPPSRFPPGTVLGERYRIVSFLGRGGMGEVYRADDLRLGEPVALKLLPPAIEHNQASRERLLEEARIARKITHPNVCRVHDVGETEGRHYLSMEYVDGEDLASLLRRIGRLPAAKAREAATSSSGPRAAAGSRGCRSRPGSRSSRRWPTRWRRRIRSGCSTRTSSPPTC